MTSRHLQRFAFAAFVAAVVFAPAAEARSRTRTGQFETSRGRSGTYVENTRREPGSLHRDRTVTTSKGRTASQNVDRTWNRETGSGSFTRTQTGPHGKSRTVAGTAARTGEGTLNTEGTIQRKNGATGSFSTSTQQMANGRSTAGTYTTAQGNTGTINRTTVRDGNTATTSSVVTLPNGSARSASTTTTVQDGVATRTHTVTSPAGETRSRTVTATPDRAAP